MPVEISNIARTFEKLDLPLPPDAQLVVDVQAAAGAAATDDPIAPLRADLLAGTVAPADVKRRVDEAAVALLVREKARDVNDDLARVLTALACRALVNNGDAIVAILRPRFDAAADVLAATTSLLGDMTQKAALAAGAGALNAWQRRDAALVQLNLVRRARLLLAESGYGPEHEDASWWVAAITDPANANHAYRDKFAGLLGAGYQLRLNTAAEADEILGGARLTIAHRDAEARDAQQRINELEAERLVAPWRKLAPTARR